MGTKIDVWLYNKERVKSHFNKKNPIQVKEVYKVIFHFIIGNLINYELIASVKK